MAVDIFKTVLRLCICSLTYLCQCVHFELGIENGFCCLFLSFKELTMCGGKYNSLKFIVKLSEIYKIYACCDLFISQLLGAHALIYFFKCFLYT